MKLQCTKREFKDMIIACNESASCLNCALRNYCGEKEKGELIADVAEIVPDEEESK